MCVQLEGAIAKHLLAERATSVCAALACNLASNPDRASRTFATPALHDLNHRFTAFPKRRMPPGAGMYSKCPAGDCRCFTILYPITASRCRLSSAHGIFVIICCGKFSLAAFGSERELVTDAG